MPRDPDILVDLTSARTEFEAETIAEALRAQGIPTQTFATAGSVLQWDVAVSQPIRVAVRRRDLEEARAILRAIRAESVDLDWSEVDTGDRTPVSAEERPDEPRRVQEAIPGRSGALLAFLLLAPGLWLVLNALSLPSGSVALTLIVFAAAILALVVVEMRIWMHRRRRDRPPAGPPR